MRLGPCLYVGQCMHSRIRQSRIRIVRYSRQIIAGP